MAEPAKAEPVEKFVDRFMGTEPTRKLKATESYERWKAKSRKRKERSND